MATLTTSGRSLFTLPNQLTAARLVLSIVLFALIAAEWWLTCIFVFAAAAVTDWLDGYFARRHGSSSSLGRVFDPLVDKVLISGAFIFLLTAPDRGGLAPWMVTIVVARELIITGLRSFVENRGVQFGADWLGKLKMGLQCAALFGIFASLYGQRIGNTVLFTIDLLLLRDGLNYAMVGATAISGLQYLWKAAWILPTSGSEP
jgi:CDP-diacylglycerol---glycerol-3-phosphate 3-phosphatidyltransferase